VSSLQNGGDLFIDIEIMLPYCTLENEPDLLRETIKASIIARYSSIFRVSKILLYNGRRTNQCSDLRKRLVLFLSFFRSPPYLRKKIFGRRKELKYAGLGYPLQIPSHVVKAKPKEGEIREGLILKVGEGKALVDAGLSKPVWVELKGRDVKEKELQFFKVLSVSPLKLEMIESPGSWMGYAVEDVGFIQSYLKKIKGKRMVIGTSRRGEPFWENLRDVKEMGEKAGWNMTVVFGEPYRGLYEIAQELSLNLNEYFDGIYNFVKDQGTKTIRTEEAIPIVLSELLLLSLIDEGATVR